MKAKKLRELLQRPHIVKVAGAHNALSAKLVERAGFDAVWASGLEISTAHAVPDANILTMTEFLNAGASMNEAVSIPIVADCDTGFGNSNNVIYMVKKYETAGIAAVCIEDKHFPKVNSFVPGRQELASIAEFVGKIMAAKNAQRSEDFMVIARVEALIAGWGMEEALKRAHAYVDAGADAILIHSKHKLPDEIFEFAKRWENRTPLVAVPTTYYTITADELETAGIKMVIYANHGLRASIKAVDEILGEIYRQGSTRTVEDKIVIMKDVFDIQGMPKMKEDERVFLRSDKDKVLGIIPAAGDHLEEYSMKDISADIPMAMLDINGKPLLQRQIEVLNKVGVSEIYVVGGYRKEKITVDGIRVIDNPDYKTTGILHSVMCGIEFMQGKIFIAYSDIIFDDVIVNRLFQSDEDIAILIDATYDSKNYASDKKLDLVISDTEPFKARRRLHDGSLKQIVKVGLNVSSDEAHYEFPGLMVLSPKGTEIFKDMYFKSLKRYSGKPFHGAPTFEQAGMADLLQEIIDSGYKVSGLEVNSGWIEVHSFDDYKLACSIVK